MPPVILPAAPLTGGVSTQPPANRFDTQVESSDNSLNYINRGLEKRYGGTYVSSISLSGASADTQTKWVRRSKSTRYMVCVNKNNAPGNRVQVFGSDGTKKTVTISSEAEDYISSGSDSTLDSIVMETYGDTTFILNKNVVTALRGAAPGYTIDSAVSELTIPPATANVGDYFNLTSSDVGYPVGIYEALTDDNTGPWYERKVSDAANSYLDETTMPMLLVYDPVTDTFDCDVADWNARLSGDSLTNPGPSFIGYTLSGMAIFQDRLWLSGGQFVLSSQAGDLFNFWVDDWTTLVDSDPIDITLSGESVNSAAFMIPFDRTLVVLGEGSIQWELQALSAFTPSETNLVETTDYRVSSDAFPVKIANQLYFISDQDRYSYLWEYFPNFDRDANIGENISLHVAEYIPPNVRRLSASKNNNLVFCWSEDETNHLYLYTTSWRTAERSQSAWCRWVFDESLDIFSFEVIDNILYIVFRNSIGELWLETIPITPPAHTSDGSITDTASWALLTESGNELTTESGVTLVLDQGESTGVGYHMVADRKVVTTGVYDAATKTTTYTLPFWDPEMDSVVLGDQWGSRRGTVIASTTSGTGTSPTTLTVSGDYATYPVVIGKSYVHSVVLSPPFIKNEQGIPIQGSLLLRSMDILFEDAVTFDVRVTQQGRPTKTRRYLAQRLGSSVLGQQTIEDFGKFNVKVRGNSLSTRIELYNDTVFPCLFTNIEHRGSFVRSRNNPTKR